MFICKYKFIIEPSFGPFISLPQVLQLKVIGFLYHCPRITNEMKFVLRKVFFERRDDGDDRAPSAIKSYVEILSEKFLLK